jgi:hypothetical protein
LSELDGGNFSLKKIGLTYQFSRFTRSWIPVFTGMTTWVRRRKNLFKELRGLSFLRKQSLPRTGCGESRFYSLVLIDSKGISVIFLVIAMLLMITIGYVFSYLIPSKQKSVVFPIQSTQAFFIAQSGVEFAVKYANSQTPPWTTTTALLGLNGATVRERNLGAGRFYLTYTNTTDTLVSDGYVPTGSLRRSIRVSNFTKFLMSITYLGYANTPRDNQTNTANPTAVDPTPLTPNVAMQAGDLVLMTAVSRDSSATIDILETGGQTWTSEVQQDQTNCRIRLFWCRFNGTWTANPSVYFGRNNRNPHIVVMHVFRPSNTSSVWQVDVPQVPGNYPAPGGAHTVTIPGITTITDGALIFAYWASQDNNTWENLTAGWTTPGLDQYRNSSGNDQSETHAYRVMATAGATGNVSKDQTSGGSDRGAYLIIAFKAVITCP